MKRNVGLRGFSAGLWLVVLTAGGVAFGISDTRLTRSSNQPVAVFWVGEPPVGAPALDIGAVKAAYENRGYRIVHADRIAPETLKELVTLDRQSHPAAYRGTNVVFVVHGRGAVPTAPHVQPGTVLDLGMQSTRPVRDEELIIAFLNGIGDSARGEIFASTCFAGAACRDVDISGTILSKRVSRLVVPSRPQPLVAVPKGTRVPLQAVGQADKVLMNLLDVMLGQTTVGDVARQRKAWTSSGPIGELEKQLRHPNPPTSIQVPELVPPSSLLSLGSVAVELKPVPPMRPSVRERLGFFK